MVAFNRREHRSLISGDGIHHDDDEARMKTAISSVCMTLCIAFAVMFDASSAEAQQTATGYVHSIQVDGPSDYLVVTLSSAISGGTIQNICYTTPPSTGGHTYGVYYALSNAAKDTIRESFRAMLMTAMIGGRQITVTTTYTATECQITDITIVS